MKFTKRSSVLAILTVAVAANLAIANWVNPAYDEPDWSINPWSVTGEFDFVNDGQEPGGIGWYGQPDGDSGISTPSYPFDVVVDGTAGATWKSSFPDPWPGSGGSWFSFGEISTKLVIDYDTNIIDKPWGTWLEVLGSGIARIQFTYYDADSAGTGSNIDYEWDQDEYWQSFFFIEETATIALGDNWYQKVVDVRYSTSHLFFLGGEFPEISISLQAPGVSQLIVDTVPEPSTLGFLALGIVSAIKRRR